MSFYVPYLSEKVSSFADIIEARSTTQPNSLAYSFLDHNGEQEKTYTYAQLHQACLSIGKLIQTYIAPSERAILLYEPGDEYILSYFSCLYSGVIAVPVFLSKFSNYIETLQKIIYDSQASAVLTTQSNADMLNKVSVQFPFMKALKILPTDGVKDEAAVYGKLKTEANKIAFLQYTSGSTSQPKGVKVSHANLLHNSALIHKAFKHNQESVVVSWLPPYHDMGLIGGILQPLYGGFPAHIMSPVSFILKPKTWLDAVSKYKATSSGGPNFAYELCIRKVKEADKTALDLSHWQVAFNGAEQIKPETLERFVDAFSECGFKENTFFPCYGLAEATLFVSGGQAGEKVKTLDVDKQSLEQNHLGTSLILEKKTMVSSGCLHAEQNVKIVVPNTNKLAEAHQIGEIWISGDSVSSGYWNNAESTAQVFNLSIEGAEGAFMKTGDLGYIHDQHLYITGRSKELIIIRGRNIYPNDIEASVEKACEQLRPGCIAAFATEDDDGSEKLIVVAETKDKDLAEGSAKEFLRQARQVIAEKFDIRLERLILIPKGKIPKTSSGKLKRQLCKSLFMADSFTGVQV